MTKSLDLDALAQEMKAAQDSARQLQPFTSRFQKFDLSIAYRVAGLIHQARLGEGAKPVGRKIGFTNRDMWPPYGVSEPIWAYVYEQTVVQLEDLQFKCPIERFCEPKIEPEIVFHLSSDLTTGAQIADVVNAVDWVAHGFEIVQSHFPEWHFQAPDTVADWGLHGTLLIGPPQSLSALEGDPVVALESLSVNLSCGGELIETGQGSNVLGNPIAAIVHLVSVLEKQPDHAPLKAGEIISTGTITTAHSVDVGQTWRSEFKGGEFAGLTIEFVP